MTTFAMASIHNAYTSFTTTHTIEVVTMTVDTHNIANEIALLESYVASDTFMRETDGMTKNLITKEQCLDAIESLTEEALDIYSRAKASVNSARRNPSTCSIGSFEEDAVELSNVIVELRTMGLTEICEHCEKLHSLMISVYEGIVMSQEEILLSKARTVHASYKKSLAYADVKFMNKAVRSLASWEARLTGTDDVAAKSFKSLHSLYLGELAAIDAL